MGQRPLRPQATEQRATGLRPQATGHGPRERRSLSRFAASGTCSARLRLAQAKAGMGYPGACPRDSHNAGPSTGGWIVAPGAGATNLEAALWMTFFLAILRMCGNYWGYGWKRSYVWILQGLWGETAIAVLIRLGLLLRARRLR